jgi:hypothetical protein
MSFEITTAFVDQFKNNVTLLSQQRGSRLRGAVRSEMVNGKRHAFEQIGATTALQRTTRHGDSPLISTPHSRRWVSLTDYEWGDLIDDQDKVRMLIDPASPYAQNAAWAMGRAMDDVIIDAAFGTAVTGETGTGSDAWSPTAYDNTNASTDQLRLEDDYDEAAGLTTVNTGLTVAKLRAARTIFRAKEVDESQPLYIACSAQQIQDLLRETEVTSSDYTNVKALVNGEVNSFMGFTFFVTQRVDMDATVTTERKCIAWARDGLALGIGMDDEAKIAERSDKSFSTYVYRRMSIGAVRLENAKVLEIRCEEPADTA